MTHFDWQPTCSVETLRLRAIALAAVRDFFDEQGYLEVETPLVSRDVVVDAHLDPFRLANSDSLFLQTSPEAAMKRLLANGSGSIYQITKAFRCEESGRRHNPEFTIVEWYGVDSVWQQQMEFTENLIRAIHCKIRQQATAQPLSHSPFLDISYKRVFAEKFGIDILSCSISQLQALAKTELPSVTSLPDDSDDLLNLLLNEHIEPELGQPHPQFLHSYPIDQAALAEASPDDSRTACRFELYWRGVELCNGYQELRSLDELKSRDRQQNQKRTVHSNDELPGAQRMNDAMQAGLPKCSGVALGFDRVLMVMLNQSEIDSVIPFPWDRA